MDKYLTVEQIYITEDNIVKYDEIQVCQIGLPDRENLIRYQDLSLLQDPVRDKVWEVLEGVGLHERNVSDESVRLENVKEDLFSADHENRFDQIVHLNSVNQKIFTSLLNPVR